MDPASAVPAPPPVSAPVHPLVSQEEAAGALDRGEIGAHYQPIVSLAPVGSGEGQREIVGFEALARWTTPSGQTIGPDAFMPPLIEAGRGLDVAERIAGAAGRALSGWLADAPGQKLDQKSGQARVHERFVAVNVAASDLAERRLAGLIQRVMAKHGLPRGALVIELGEGELNGGELGEGSTRQRTAAAAAAADAVRDAGARLAMDDFGAGCSDLVRLSAIRFDVVKTDKSLAHASARDADARAALAGVVHLAHAAGVTVIAEGIEDEETARRLAALGCDLAQGYLFGRAVPASALPDQLGAAR